MRVAMVSFDAGEYGVQVANAICDQADVLLLSPRVRRRALRVEAEPQDRVAISSILPRIRQAPQQLLAMSKLRRAIGRFRPDVVHVQHVHLWFSLGCPLFAGTRSSSRCTTRCTMSATSSRPHATEARALGLSPRRSVDHARRAAQVGLGGRHPFAGGRITVIPHVAHSSDGPDATVAERGQTVALLRTHLGVQRARVPDPSRTVHFGARPRCRDRDRRSG